MEELLRTVEGSGASADPLQDDLHLHGGRHKGRRKKNRLLDSAPLPERDRGKERTVSQAKHIALIHEAICTLFSTNRVQLNGFDPTNVDILDVNMSPDGKNVTIMWDVTAQELNPKEIKLLQTALDRASYKIRTTIASAKRLRSAPRLEWRNDRQRVAQEATMDHLFHLAQEEMKLFPDQIMEAWEVEKVGVEGVEGERVEEEVEVEEVGETRG